MRPGKSDTQISYRQLGENTWVPDTWRVASFLGDETQLRQARYGKVTEVTLNADIPADTFHIEFPPGTWVTNVYTKDVHASYIIREGKPIRPVLPGEYTGDNYEAILNSEPPLPSGDGDDSEDDR